ncbi:hypothetical protein DUI70_1842 [Streptomyces albus]|nr:hypothetical protein SLNHY_1871 [Streptomyces albus]AYN32345.1 hypothetical protein DUI70_1842 [Streptomyces albus]
MLALLDLHAKAGELERARRGRPRALLDVREPHRLGLLRERVRGVLVALRGAGALRGAVDRRTDVDVGERRVRLQVIGVDVELLRLDLGAAGLTGGQGHRHIAEHRDGHDDGLAEVGDLGRVHTDDGDRVLTRLAAVERSVLDEALTVKLVGSHLELLTGHTERCRERTLREGDTYRGSSRDARHHDYGEPLPSGSATSQGLHDFPPSRTYISGPDLLPEGRLKPGRDGRSATSSGRRAPASEALERSEPRRSPPSDNHRPRLRATSLGQAPPDGRDPPVLTDATAIGHSVGTHCGPRSQLACGQRGNGPSLADRGASSAPAQGVSLPTGNGWITRPRLHEA